MDNYRCISTASPPAWQTRSGTCAIVASDMFPEKTSLSELTDDPDIPEEYDPENDNAHFSGAPSDFDALVPDLLDFLPYDSVLFQGGVVVMLPPKAQFDEKFMSQIDGDLLFYASVTHRYPNTEFSKQVFEQTASWWRTVREGDREDAVMILKALYRLHQMPYPGPGFSGSNSDVGESFVHKTDPTDFAAITHTWEGRQRQIITIVNAGPTPEGRWANDSREYSMATIGRDMLRLCMMQPRVDFVHRKKREV